MIDDVTYNFHVEYEYYSLQFQGCAALLCLVSFSLGQIVIFALN